MSSGIVLLIVVAVILVIVAYLVGILIRKRNDSRIAQLEERKQKLFDLPINEEIEEVKKLHLIGQSQTTFREWNQKWIDISTNSFADIENHIFEAENMNDTFHFFKASGEINNIESQLDLVEEDIKSIREALSTLKEQEEKNSARVKHALDLYEELQNSIEENSDNFGSTMGEINKQLKNIESEFAEFVTLNSSGDPVEASSILDRAEEHTIALGQISEKIPAIVAKLEDDFPDQLDDLESGYRKLIEQNYHFPEKNIERRFQEIREAIRSNSSELVSLDLDRAEEENADIQEKIDNLYSIFEREIASYKAVIRQKKILPDYLKHAKENNKKLQEELERLMLTYIFDETYAADVRSFASDISSVETAVLPTLENFDNQVKPFSELEKIFEKSLNTLSAVENGQVEVFSPQGGSWILSAEDYEVAYEGLDANNIAVEGNMIAELDLTLTPELEREGVAREISRFLNQMRKDADFAVEQKVKLTYTTASEYLKAILKEFDEMFKGEALLLTIEEKEAD